MSSGLGRASSGRNGGMACGVAGICGRVRWKQAKKERERDKEKWSSRMSASSIPGSRHAGLWAAVVIASLSLLVVISNASLIASHFASKEAKARETPVKVVGGREGLSANLRAQGRGMKLETIESLESSHGRGGYSLKPLPPSLSFSAINTPPRPHPCRGFTLPPPPADKKRTGPRPCPVCYLPVGLAMQQMPAARHFVSPVLKHLSYVSEPEAAVPSIVGASGSAFGGYPTLEEREQAFKVQESMHVHCGFVKGSTPGVGTGFDIDEDNLLEMEQCHGIVVASAIFGNYDQLQQPKNISEEAKNMVCFYMFVDEETEISYEEYSDFQSTKKVGLWHIVLVRNLPYTDSRRNGKIPKLLLHRLFPNAQFSLWVDGKLELIMDPFQILERFLWRSNDTFAISQHYRRFDVFAEAEANKAAAKYDNTSIDAQIEFYRGEGMMPYSSAKLPITSDVPEGCVIIREHTPIANLFSCLWFNDVDRFTPRDQLSYGIVRDKLMANVPWRINMFLDCERRNFVVQAYHRDLLEHRAALGSLTSSGTEGTSVGEVRSAPSTTTNITMSKSVVKPRVSVRKVSSRHRKEGRGRHNGH